MKHMHFLLLRKMQLKIYISHACQRSKLFHFQYHNHRLKYHDGYTLPNMFIFIWSVISA